MKKKKEDNLIRADITLISIGILALIAIHLLSSDGSVIKNSLSNYAAGEYGYIVSTVFYLFALVNVTIGILFFHFKNKKVKLGSLLFFLSGIFIVMLTVFHVDGNGLIETYNEYIHVISASLLFLTYPALILINGLQFKTKPLKIYSIISFIIVALLTIAGIIFTLNNLTTGLLETTLLGISEKVGVLIIVVWMIVLLLSRNKLKADEHLEN